jgi:hypothetical protein
MSQSAVSGTTLGYRKREPSSASNPLGRCTWLIAQLCSEVSAFSKCKPL